MKAAVLHSLGEPPRFEDFRDPYPRSDEVKVLVKAASLKNIDKDMARGSHYDRYAELPVVCGIDGVGILDDGTRAFCGGPPAPFGMVSGHTVVSRALWFPISDSVGDVTPPALPHPAPSSWASLLSCGQLQNRENRPTIRCNRG